MNGITRTARMTLDPAGHLKGMWQESASVIQRLISDMNCAVRQRKQTKSNHEFLLGIPR